MNIVIFDKIKDFDNYIFSNVKSTIVTGIILFILIVLLVLFEHLPNI